MEKIIFASAFLIALMVAWVAASLGYIVSELRHIVIQLDQIRKK